MKLFIYIFAIFSLVSPVLAEPLKIVCSTDNGEGSLHVETLKKFDELVREYSNGKLFAEIHYRGSEAYPAIKGEEENVKMVMTGRPDIHNRVVHVTVVATGNLSQKAGLLNFLMLPYIFPEFQSATKLFQSDYMFKELNETLAKKHKVRSLGWLIGGFRHMTNSVRPVKRFEDMKGLIIRTPKNRLMRDTYAAFGAVVKPLSWAETFDALKAGKVDRQENPYNVIFYSKFWEAKQRYVTNNGPFLCSGPIVMNEDFFQSLPPDLRNAVTRAGFEAAQYEWDWVAKRNIEFSRSLVDNGMQISDLDDKPKWVSATKKLWKKYYGIIGYGDENKGEDVVARVLAITKE